MSFNRKSPWLIWLNAPLSLLYGIVVGLRNVWFDLRWKQGHDKPPLNVTVVGNLSIGGTGKTPFVDKLLMQSDKTTTAVLSRGYGRKTKGYVVVYPDDSAERVGDEPLMIAQKHPEIVVCVCEDRQEGLRKMQKQFPHIKHVILDDAFQHRWVKPDKSHLLTTWQKPFYSDYLLPLGDLREWRSGAKRASEIAVTKCPDDLTSRQKDKIVNAIRKYSLASVSFYTIRYGAWKCVNGSNHSKENPLVVTGIANPNPLYEHLEKQKISFSSRAFSDHQFFSQSDIDTLLLKRPKCILTTEKDWTRMAHFDWKDTSVFVIPIEIHSV